MTVPLESGVLVSADSEERECRMRVLHEAMKIVVGPLPKCELRGFVVEKRELAAWKWELLPVSYCCDFPEDKNMSTSDKLLR